MAYRNAQNRLLWEGPCMYVACYEPERVIIIIHLYNSYVLVLTYALLYIAMRTPSTNWYGILTQHAVGVTSRTV